MTENIICPEETKRLQYLGNYYCNQWRSLPKREERRKGEGEEEGGEEGGGRRGGRRGGGELRVRSEHSLVPRPLSEKSKKGLHGHETNQNTDTPNLWLLGKRLTSVDRCVQTVAMTSLHHPSL